MLTSPKFGLFILFFFLFSFTFSFICILHSILFYFSLFYLAFYATIDCMILCQTVGFIQIVTTISSHLSSCCWILVSGITCKVKSKVLKIGHLPCPSVCLSICVCVCVCLMANGIRDYLTASVIVSRKGWTIQLVYFDFIQGGEINQDNQTVVIT